MPQPRFEPTIFRLKSAPFTAKQLGLNNSHFSRFTESLIAAIETRTPDIKHPEKTKIGNNFIPFPSVFAFTAPFSIFDKICTLKKGKQSETLITTV